MNQHRMHCCCNTCTITIVSVNCRNCCSNHGAQHQGQPFQRLAAAAFSSRLVFLQGAVSMAAANQSAYKVRSAWQQPAACKFQFNRTHVTRAIQLFKADFKTALYINNLNSRSLASLCLQQIVRSQMSCFILAEN